MISAALPADYLASGSVWPTRSPGRQVQQYARAVVEAMLLKLVFDLGAEWHRTPAKPSQKSLSKSAK